MRALWLEGGTLRVREDVPEPRADAGEAVVSVVRAGICNTDLELQRGYYPFTGVPGHEFVGLWQGRRVVGEINAVCGACAACAAGRGHHCERRTVLGIVGRQGALASLLALPAANLHDVPEGVTDDEAVFVEPLAAALQIQEQVRIGAGDRVLVVGDGKLGNLIAQSLRLRPCDLAVVGRNPAKRDLLRMMGVRTLAPDEVRAAGADIVVECTGNPEGWALARRAVRPRGTIVMKSTYAGDVRIDFSSLVVDEITMVGSRCGPFAPAIALLAERKVDVGPLVHARYALGDAVAAFAHAARPGTMKVLVSP
jgi:threonine dehydrogenase-like Zn-dependent dehydrogenase